MKIWFHDNVSLPPTFEPDEDIHLQIQVPAVTRHDLGQRSLDAREPIRMVVLRALDAYGVAVPKEAIVDRWKIR